MSILPFPRWVEDLEDTNQRMIDGYARYNPVFCHNLDVAHTVPPLRPVLIEEAAHWAKGRILRSILENESDSQSKDYWPRQSWRDAGKQAELRHITAETGHEAISVRAQIDDEVIKMLRPLVARAINYAELYGGADMDIDIPGVYIPGGYWLRCQTSKDDLVGVIGGHNIGGKAVLTAIHVQPVRRYDDIPTLTVSTLGLQSASATDGQGADGLEDIERCIAWAWLLSSRREPI